MYLRLDEEKIKYILIGIVTTIFNIVFFTIFYNYLDTKVLTLLDWFFTVLLSYILSTIFMYESNFKLNVCIKYFLSRVITCMLDMLIIWIGSKFIYNTLLLKCIDNGIIIVMNYILLKLVVFIK